MLHRLDDERVGPHVDRQLFVPRIRIGCGMENKRHPFQPFIGFPFTAESITVHYRHKYIRYNHIRCFFQGLCNRFAAVARLYHLIPMALQHDAKEFKVFFDIINDQNPFHGIFLISFIENKSGVIARVEVFPGDLPANRQR